MTTANLSVSDNVSVVHYTSIGESAFVYPFPILSTDELKVSVDQVLKTLSTDYTVSGVGDEAGGTVTFNSATSAGEKIGIWLDMPIKRLTGFNLGANTLLPQDLNTEFTRQVRIDQMLRTDIRRSIHLAIDDPQAGQDMVMPTQETRAGKVLAFDSGGVPTVLSVVSSEDASLRADLAAQTAAKGFNLVSITPTAAEVSAGLIITNPQYLVGNVWRYGILPNDASLKTANTTALRTLLDPTTGLRGRIYFPPFLGADTYHLDNWVECGTYDSEEYTEIDLCGTRLLFDKDSYDAADDTMGFLSFIQNVTLKNGKIEVDYDGSAGTNAGMVLRVGSRIGYKFHTDVDGVEDEDLTVPQGNIRLENLKLTTNNTGPELGVFYVGGLVNVHTINCEFDGQNVCEHPFYYEFGFYHHEATVANRTSSHALNLTFENIVGRDLKRSANGAVVSVIGASSWSLKGIHGEDCYHVIEFRPGEALFYNVGAPYVEGGRTRRGTISNITGQGVVNGGMALIGAESASGGYLSGEALSDDEQSDLMAFDIDTVSVDSHVATINGPFSLRNATGRGAGSSGSLIIGADCPFFSLDNVHLLDGAGPGVRGNITSPVRTSQRRKFGSIRNSKICGNVGGAIELDFVESCELTNNQLGYHTDFDGVSETTQTVGVNVAANARGVICDGNYVATNSGTAYVKAGSDGDRNCDIRNARGEQTITAGQWKLDGVARANSTNIANDTASINANDKYLGKKVFDTSNKRILIAAGAGATDDWDVVDGSASVTPV